MKKFSPNTNNVFNNDQPKIKQKGKISHGDIDYIPIDNILPGSYQVRKDFSEESLVDLKTSIAQQGLLQPVTVRKLDNNKYELISGERRWRASRMAGLTHIPAIISYFTDESALALGIIENIQRENLNPVEEANGYKKLIDEFGYTHIQISSSIGKSRAHITNLLRVLSLEQDIQDSLISNKISLGHAKVILSVSDNKRKEFCSAIIAGQLSVRDAEKTAKSYMFSPSNDLNNTKIDLSRNELIAIQRLKSLLNRDLSFKKLNNGRLKMEYIFTSDFDLDDLIECLKIVENISE